MADVVDAPRRLIQAMDTVFSVAIPGLPAPVMDELITAIAADLEETEAELSVFRPQSEINRWSRGLIQPAELSPGVRQVIAACDDLERSTGGLFTARRDGGYDPTGYVKGWALSRAADRLDAAGVTAYCVNGGGDIVARGTGPHGVPWRIGVAHPNRLGELATIVTAEPGDDRRLAVATSGTTERGQHVVNPISGARPQHGAVTVVGHDIALVDAIATAALAAGIGGQRLVRQFGLEAIGFDEDARPWWTPGMSKYALLPQFAGSAAKS